MGGKTLKNMERVDIESSTTEWLHGLGLQLLQMRVFESAQGHDSGWPQYGRWGVELSLGVSVAEEKVWHFWETQSLLPSLLFFPKPSRMSWLLLDGGDWRYGEVGKKFWGWCGTAVPQYGMLPKNESTPLQFLPISTLSAVCQGSQSCSSVMHSMKGCPLRPRCSCSTIPTPHQLVHTNARPQHNGPFPMSRSASQQAKPLLCFSERYGRNSRRHGETSSNDPPILAIWRTCRGSKPAIQNPSRSPILPPDPQKLQVGNGQGCHKSSTRWKLQNDLSWTADTIQFFALLIIMYDWRQLHSSPYKKNKWAWFLKS